MDEVIKDTFNMLVERLSVLEERSERATRAAILAESYKIGRLNKEIFGFNCKLNRVAPDYEDDCEPEVSALVLVIAFSDTCDCTHTRMMETVDVDLIQRYESIDDTENITSSALGWSNSRHADFWDELHQRYMDILFTESPFKVDILDTEMEILTLLFALVLLIFDLLSLEIHLQLSFVLLIGLLSLEINLAKLKIQMLPPFFFLIFEEHTHFK